MGGEDLAEQNGIPNRAWLVLAKVYRLSGGRVGSPLPLTLVLLRDSFLRSYASIPSDPTGPNDRPLTSYVRLYPALCPSFIPLSSFFYPSFTLLSPFFHPNSFEIFEEKLALRNLQFLCCLRSRKDSIFKGHRSSTVYIVRSWDLPTSFPLFVSNCKQWVAIFLAFLRFCN